MAPMTESQKAWRKRNIEKVRSHDRKRKREERTIEEKRLAQLKASKKHWQEKGRYTRYGITKLDFEQMMIEQNSRCKTCQRPAADSRGGVLVIDHCHKTKRVRGLLCHNCNVVLGLVSERTEVLEALVALLKQNDLRIAI